MSLDNKSSIPDIDIYWPIDPIGILIMGKRQGTKRENKQLWGRTAMAAALWYSAPMPKPYLIFVASDVHGPFLRSDADVVKSMLVNDFGISSDYVIIRRVSNCTLLEVRAARVLKRAYDLGHIFALTHLYHVPRTQRYLAEVLPKASVIPVHPDILAEVQFPFNQLDLWARLQMVIADSLPEPLDQLRELLVETILTAAHMTDHRGKLERILARVLRPAKPIR